MNTKLKPTQPRDNTLQAVILEHLQSKGEITSRDAFSLYGITRLSDVVFKLRRLGWDIESPAVDVTTRYKHTARIAVYSLKGSRV